MLFRARLSIGVMGASVAGTVGDVLLFASGVSTPGVTGGDKGAGSGNFGSLFVSNIAVVADINALTLVNNPANGGFVAGYDSTAAAVRKFRVGEVGGWVPLEEQTASASANLNFVLTNYLTDFEDFEFCVSQLLPATSAVDLLMRTSTDGGATYDSGASNYSYMNNGRNDAGTFTGAASDTATSIQFTTSVTIGNTAGNGWDGRAQINNPSLALPCKINYEGIYSNNSNYQHIEGSGVRKANADVDAVRFLMSSGNIASGKITLLGRRKVT